MSGGGSTCNQCGHYEGNCQCGKEPFVPAPPLGTTPLGEAGAFVCPQCSSGRRWQYLKIGPPFKSEPERLAICKCGWSNENLLKKASLRKEREKVKDYLKGMSVPEIREFVMELEDEMGVSLSEEPNNFVGAPAYGGPPDEDDYDIILMDAGESWIRTLKILRELTGFDLKGAKHILDNLPQTIFVGLRRDQAFEVKTRLEAEGAKVKIEP